MTFKQQTLEPQIVEQMQRIHTRLLKYCMSVTGSPWDAEDLAQDACVKAMPVLTCRLSHDNPEAYVKRIAKTTWIDHQRRKRHLEVGWKTGMRPGSRQDTYPVELEPALQVAVRVLSPLQRTVLLLQDVLGYRAHETARALRTTEGAVKAALQRARKTLKERRTPEEDVVFEPSADSDAVLVKAYAEAIQDGDAERIVRLYCGESAAISDAIADRVSGLSDLDGTPARSASAVGFAARKGKRSAPDQTIPTMFCPLMQCAA
jgi:RNA polymerase sigma-70 factor (ECF subfamily)